MLLKLAATTARQTFNQRQLHKVLRANQHPHHLRTCQEILLGRYLSTNQSHNDQVRCHASELTEVWQGTVDDHRYGHPLPPIQAHD